MAGKEMKVDLYGFKQFVGQVPLMRWIFVHRFNPSNSSLIVGQKKGCTSEASIRFTSIKHISHLFENL